MKVFLKPRVVISKCREFEHVRWDGEYPEGLVDIEALTAHCDGKDYWR